MFKLFIFPPASIHSWTKITAVASAIYSLFNTISVFLAADTVLTSFRHRNIFENFISAPTFAFIYLALTIYLIVGVFWNKNLVLGFSLLSLLSIFWGVIALIPIDYAAPEPSSSLINASGFLLLAFFTGVFATLSYHCHNSPSRRT